jgi:hypothetical protein
MIKDRGACFASIRGRVIIVVAALIAPLAALGIVSPTVAMAAKEPTGLFAVFKDCPRFTAGVELCQYSQITGGVVTLNRLSVPITNTITWQGGIHEEEGTGKETFFEAINGETFSREPQSVPGGLSSLIDCNEITGRGFQDRTRRGLCEGLLQHSWWQGVSETTELAEPTSDVGINRTAAYSGGIALSLPVRFHLESPLLGRDCYIGSSTEPVVLNLTWGTTSPPPPNTPISGHFPTAEILEGGQLVYLPGVSSVDNTFAVPAATGCGGPFAFLIDPLINSKVGLPSPAGNNTVIHNGYDYVAYAPTVIKSEADSETGDEGGDHTGEHHGHGPSGPDRW